MGLKWGFGGPDLFFGTCHIKIWTRGVDMDLGCILVVSLQTKLKKGIRQGIDTPTVHL